MRKELAAKGEKKLVGTVSFLSLSHTTLPPKSSQDPTTRDAIYGQQELSSTSYSQLFLPSMAMTISKSLSKFASSNMI